jgi:DNA-binding MarR family transcriptional regulator
VVLGASTGAEHGPRFGVLTGRATITSAYADDQARTGMTDTEANQGDGASPLVAGSSGHAPGHVPDRSQGSRKPQGTGRSAGSVGSAGPAGSVGSEPMLLYLIKQVELAVRSRLDDLLRPAGLTALQYTALTVLERHPDMSSAQLARNSFVTAQSMADMITALEGRGLIERHRDRADRRRLVVALTVGGRQLLDRYRNEVAALEAQMLTGLTRTDVSTLRRNLQSCRTNLARN